MLGPTSFVPLITTACNIVRTTGKYHILIIITDGIIDDVKETTAAIVAASRLPLSIVCVGVGHASWETMKEFDDKLPERSFDNFQFVEYEKQECDVNFACAALQEIPEQYRTIKEHGLLGLKPVRGAAGAVNPIVYQPHYVYGIPVVPTSRVL